MTAMTGTSIRNEGLRLAALNQYYILDTEREAQFDDIAELAGSICQTPMAAVSLVDEKRQWFKSRVGIGLAETPRDIAFCSHTIEQDDLFVINDAWKDARFADNPLVTGDPHVRFYAGAPLINSEGFALGSLAVLDHVPRELNAEQQRALCILSHEVVAQIELRKSVRTLRELVTEKEHGAEQLRQSQRELERRVTERTAELRLVNARLKREAAQRARDAALSQAIIDSLPGTFYLFDRYGRFLRWNRNFELISECTGEEVARANPLDFFGSEEEKNVVAQHIEEAFREGCTVVEASMRTKSGGLIPYYFTGERIELDGRACLSGMGIDITEIKNYERQLERQANYDALTALVNRNVLKDRIGQAIAVAQRQGTLVTIGFMDLDNFKFINDSHGHTVGDELLKRVAERLATCLREEDTVARYGGDEFAFVLVGQKDEESIGALMERVLKTIDRPFSLDRHKFFVSCSIGLSLYPRDGSDVDTLLKNADVAMYRAKERGRNNFQFYTPAMNRRVTERLALESRLRQALENGEFAVHYQPKVDLRSGRIVGAEALLRWIPDGDGAAVAPSSFIPLAEETGLIIPIGEWVLQTACVHNKMLQDAGLPPIRVAVNISARQFEATTIGLMVRAALSSSGLDASHLELELTESLVMKYPEEAIKVLRELKEMGLRLAIDDFGTGYSSLSYLQRFPVDRLKIDQSFVRDIGADPNDAIIARAVISLGHSLGMSVVAEGVSSPEQLAFLRENGCDEVQGYLFSRAVPIEEIHRMLAEKRGLTVH